MNFASAAIEQAHNSALRSIQRVVAETAEPTPPERALASVTAQLRAGRVMVLTGAGVSTDSGVPDYRGPEGTLGRHRPMTYQEFRHDPVALHRYWARSFVGWRVMNKARPNACHEMLAALESAGYVSGVVTQNVDGLHQAAGQGTVIPLHGDLDRVVCLACGHVEARPSYDERAHAANPGYLDSIEVDHVNPDGDVALPEDTVARFRLVGCERCGSELLKPDVVYFGEPVPAARKDAAYALLERSDSLLVAGSSLAVMSGFRFVIDAQKAGKQVAVINGGPGRADARVDTLWRTALAPALREVCAALGVSLAG